MKIEKKLMAVSVLATIQFGLSFETYAESSLKIEEIIVTAQKRQESLQDVPVAVYAVMGEEMRSSGIEKMDALAAIVPSLHVSEALGGDQVFLRGLGPGVNLGFEQAVGQVVDGYFYGRSRFSRLQFLDLERVEVLKGPQGAILGKNTTSGAMNITTAKPTSELEGWISVGHEFDGAEGQTYEGAISGPISDTISARIALRYEDKDGYLDNKTSGNEDQGREDFTGRLSVRYEPTEKFSALVQYALSDVERTGRTTQLIACSPAAKGYIAANGIREDCKLNGSRSTSATLNGVGDDFEGTETDAETFGLTLAWDFDDFTVTSLTGYAEYDYQDFTNTSYTDIEFNLLDIREEYEQFSQEIRIASNGGGNIDYIVGVFYQETTLDSVLDVGITSVFLPPPAPAGSMLPVNLTRHTQTSQDTETAALFSQFTWHLNDEWDLTLEGRYTKEDKDAHSIQYPTAFFDNTSPVPGPGSGGPVGIFNVHDVEDDRSESDFSPGVVIEWHPSGDAMYYLSLKKGFKGGGFDHQMGANQVQAEDGRFSFDEEEVTSVELGAKLTIADGSARLNLSLFRNEYDDLQVSSLAGIGQFVVGNAASAVTQGFEADLQWRVTEAMKISASFALLDAEYDEFVADCSVYQIQRGLCVGGKQDLSGKTLQFAPDYSYNISAEYIWPVGDNFELTGFVRFYGEDEKALAQDLDPNDTQDSFSKIDARLTLGDSEGVWELSLIGRNLSNEETLGFSNDAFVFPGSHYGISEAPRSLLVQANYRF